MQNTHTTTPQTSHVKEDVVGSTSQQQLHIEQCVSESVEKSDAPQSDPSCEECAL